ncbi:hypothetical protein BH09BAC2_BH09BAC2_13490 [soil metagenome]
MKQITRLSFSIKLFIAVLMLSLSNAVAWAQDKGANVDISVNKNTGGGWYTQPWVWIVGGAVFLLLLVALLRNNSSRD